MSIPPKVVRLTGPVSASLEFREHMLNRDTLAVMLAPEGMRKGLTYFTGYMTAAGWISLTATGSSLGAQFIVGWVHCQ